MSIIEPDDPTQGRDPFHPFASPRKSSPRKPSPGKSHTGKPHTQKPIQSPRKKQPSQPAAFDHTQGFRLDHPNQLTDEERHDLFVEIARAFGRSAAAFETAPWITGHELIARHGVATPPAATIYCDDALTETLWRIIEVFAKHNIFLDHTDHLSERALYTMLVEQILDEPVKDYATVIDTDEITQPGFWSCCYDLTEIDSLDDGWLIYLKYYATEHERDIEARVCPDQVLPERETPGYHRDAFLPRPIEERFAERGEVPPEAAWFQEALDI